MYIIHIYAYEIQRSVRKETFEDVSRMRQSNKKYPVNDFRSCAPTNYLLCN